MRNQATVYRAFLAIGLSLGLASSAGAERLSVSLGQAPPGTVDTFTVEARNASCDQPQDFRFVPNNLAWLKLIHGGYVKNIARGQSKKFVAQIDLTGLAPGHYAGRLDVVCETCGPPNLRHCRIDTHMITLEVDVVARGAYRKTSSGASVQAISD